MPVKSSKTKTRSKLVGRGKPGAKKAAVKQPAVKTAAKAKPAAKKAAPRIPAEKPVEVTRAVNLANQIRRPAKSATRKPAGLGKVNSNPFTFMKAPRPDFAFEVGDTVEVFCDHEKGRERVRGWVRGIVVQVDNKMVAVQFRSNVFLTDGWMVPDRILWYPLTSEHIRPAATGKKPAVKKEAIPDY